MHFPLFTLRRNNRSRSRRRTYISSSSISSTVAPLAVGAVRTGRAVDVPVETGAEGAEESSAVSSVGSVGSVALATLPRLSFLTRFFFFGSSNAQTGTNDSNWRQWVWGFLVGVCERGERCTSVPRCPLAW